MTPLVNRDNENNLSVALLRLHVLDTCHLLERGGEITSANRGRVITFYATQKGRVT